MILNAFHNQIKLYNFVMNNSFQVNSCEEKMCKNDLAQRNKHDYY